MKLSELKLNPANPRFIRDNEFAKLKKSIQHFPQMLRLRPIVVDENQVIIGGMMRYRALRDLGHEEVPDEWIKQECDFTEEQKRYDRCLLRDLRPLAAYQIPVRRVGLAAVALPSLPLNHRGSDCCRHRALRGLAALAQLLQSFAACHWFSPVFIIPGGSALRQ